MYTRILATLALGLTLALLPRHALAVTQLAIPLGQEAPVAALTRLETMLAQQGGVTTYDGKTQGALTVSFPQRYIVEGHTKPFPPFPMIEAETLRVVCTGLSQETIPREVVFCDQLKQQLTAQGPTGSTACTGVVAHLTDVLGSWVPALSTCGQPTSPLPGLRPADCQAALPHMQALLGTLCHAVAPGTCGCR